MRSEQEIYELILNTARDDARIRAVILVGSRANSAAPRDIFQDYDIVYIVTEIASFKREPAWIDRFGERMILQLPNEMADAPPNDNDSFVYLMQFADGNRIDLTLLTAVKFQALGRASPSILLLDKDARGESFALLRADDNLPAPPSAKAFADCCNEFWWVCPYVAKGLWRREIIYAKYMLDQITRAQLMKMLVWHIGVRTRFAQNPGKFGKYFQRYLEPPFWQALEKTFADAAYDNNWDALEASCELFRAAAVRVAEHFGFEYPYGDDERVSAHLKRVRQLPAEAKELE